MWNDSFWVILCRIFRLWTVAPARDSNYEAKGFVNRDMKFKMLNV